MTDNEANIDEAAQVRAYAERANRYDAFDKLIDMALAGEISMDTALSEFRKDYGSSSPADSRGGNVQSVDGR